jgi:hypothetical protein
MTVPSASVWPRSRICSEQRPNACGQRHGKRAPEPDTRIAPNIRRAASPPRRARNTSEVPETRGIQAPVGAIAVSNLFVRPGFHIPSERA